MSEAEEYIKALREDNFLHGIFFCYEKAMLLAENKRVLDYGCGYGWGTWLLSSMARKVVGYDPDEGRIAFARKTFLTETISFIKDEHWLEGLAYDMICLFMVLPYAEEKRAVLDRIAGYLKPGGSLWISYKTKDYALERLLEAWSKESGMRWIDSNERYLSESENVVMNVYCKQ